MGSDESVPEEVIWVWNGVEEVSGVRKVTGGRESGEGE